MAERLNKNLSLNNGNHNYSRHHHHNNKNNKTTNTRQCDRKRSSLTVMQRTRDKLRDKKMNILHKFSKDSGLIDCKKRGSKSSQSNRSTTSSNHNQNNNNNNNWADMEYSESQNSVATLDLFRYAKLRELTAIIVGIVFMIYAASWQPISVFILAIMASLMGQYSKQANLLKNLNGTSNGPPSESPAPYGSVRHGISGLVPKISVASSAPTVPIVEILSNSLDYLKQATINQTTHQSLVGLSTAESSSFGETNTTSSQLAASALYSGDHPALALASADQASSSSSSSYDEYSFLALLHSVVTPIFDLGSSSEQREADENSLKAAVNVILERESTQFLRKSFEINGSAFVLALTQLFAFFLGMTLITWAAKKQASRIKLLYFSSCLHQEVTWFEAIDSASGSGSSLNGLVDKYEDGIGMKLALLCYFLGHIGLFALTAFYQMFSLAAFCMPFVLLIGIIIAYLSDWQANSIGEHALFAKRSLQLAEEIIAAIRTVFAFNGQQKEITRYSLSLEPVYRKSLIKHLYTALNTSLSKFSIFACFAIYCFYAKHLFPPYSEHANAQNKATILAIMRGAEVSIVNILISIPFLEALQQSKGSIARIFVAIERRSKINVASTRGLKLDDDDNRDDDDECNDDESLTSASSSGTQTLPPSPPAPPTQQSKDRHMGTSNGRKFKDNNNSSSGNNNNNKRGASNGRRAASGWLPSISFRMVQFGYADRCGPTTRRRSTLPFLNLVGPYASGPELQASMTRRRSVIEQIADEAIDSGEASSKPVVASTMMGSSTGGGGGGLAANNNNTGSAQSSANSNNNEQHHTNNHHHNHHQQRRRSSYAGRSRRHSAIIRQMLGNEVNESRLGTRVLDCFNLEIKPGQSVALVGPSGSGKSTVLALVQRLYEITGGQLLIGQHDIKDLNLGWLRNQIGLVGQEPRLFDMSIAENIMLGLPEDKFDALVMGNDYEISTNTNTNNNNNNNTAIEHSRTQLKRDNGNDLEDGDQWLSDDSSQQQQQHEQLSHMKEKRRHDDLMQQVIEASKAANAHDFIVRLPNGYNTRVGSGGVQLSGGQKQRIAIARALIRKPKILLLDECTSALDTDSEAQVHAALKLSANCSKSPRTTLIVAHRLETIKHVDLIVVMNQGQVVACGTHEELMNAANKPTKGGLNAGARIYKQLYEEQLQAKPHQPPKHLGRVATGGGGNDDDILEEENIDDDDEGTRQQKQTMMMTTTTTTTTTLTADSSKKRLRTKAKAKPITSATLGSGGYDALANNDHGLDSPTAPIRATDAAAGAGGKGDTTTTSLSGLAGFGGARADRRAGGLANKVTIERGSGSSPSSSSSDDDEDGLDRGEVLEQQLDTSSEGASAYSLTTTSTTTTTSSGSQQERPNIWKLWHFMEIPKWSTVAAVLVCLLAGLILPLNLIAHSYLFSVFAYKELDQIGEYLHVFGLIILSFSTFVFIVSFLQIILPGYVGEKLSVQLRVKIMDCLLQKPMFYFDMDSNSAGAICDRFNCYISNLQSIAGTRVATMLEAVATLTAGAIFGFGQNFVLSMFCLSFALLVLITTIIESRIMEKESNLQQKYDAQLAHLMADALSNIKTIASLNRERFFVQKFNSILRQRERGIGNSMVCLHTFLTSLKFVMPAMSWSASMYYGSYLLTTGRIDLQTIYIVCPVVLFAVNDTFRALVFLPELLKARNSIERLYKMNREFSPEVLQTLTFGQQLAEQNRLHLEQLMAETGYGSAGTCLVPLVCEDTGNGGATQTDDQQRRPSEQDTMTGRRQASLASNQLKLQLDNKPKKKSISFALQPTELQSGNQVMDPSNAAGENGHRLSVHFNRRLSNIQNLPTYMSMRRKSSRLNSLVPRSNARGRIEFDGVEFAYPNRPTALVLDGFTLNIEPGESVALVGASGSGKSTTVAILEKFYDYHGGSVTLDGRDLRLVEPNWVRSQIGLVQQEPGLLSYTIGDNIRYGDNSRFVSMDEVVEAARTANIHDFIMTLPDQYDTELSSSAYSSCQLSGGQRQRIAIARALVRNAPILIFDEATSALDNKSEQVVQDALRKAKRGRTSLTIAHRLSTIMDADKIAVVRDGRVVEVGKHDELIDRPKGVYRMLWARQAENGGGVGVTCDDGVGGGGGGAHDQGSAPGAGGL